MNDNNEISSSIPNEDSILSKTPQELGLQGELNVSVEPFDPASVTTANPANPTLASVWPVGSLNLSKAISETTEIGRAHV